MKLYKVTITDKSTGEVVLNLNDVEEVLRTEDLISGEIVTRITRKGNRTSKYENNIYNITILKE